MGAQLKQTFQRVMCVFHWNTMDLIGSDRIRNFKERVVGCLAETSPPFTTPISVFRSLCPAPRREIADLCSPDWSSFCSELNAITIPPLIWAKHLMKTPVALGKPNQNEPLSNGQKKEGCYLLSIKETTQTKAIHNNLGMDRSYSHLELETVCICCG